MEAIGGKVDMSLIKCTKNLGVIPTTKALKLVQIIRAFEIRSV